MAQEFLVTIPLDRDFVQIMISGPSAEYTESPPTLSVEVERPTNAPPEEVALDPDVYSVSESSYWSINGFNFGGLFTDYDTIRRGGGERIIIDEAIIGQVDPPPENYLILASAYTTGADYTAWIENTNRTPEELNDIVIGLINQINDVVFTT